MFGNGNSIGQVIGRVQIALLADGQVQAQCEVPHRQALLMMLEVAKFDLERRLYEREQSPVLVAPPGMTVPG